ncbi:MAG: hypothetical protein RBT47_06015 [Anaerolineae bacterium]|jgi:hypothetical protein|nr:hypothetical protein [Anaerolineae bacterium]
MNKRGLVAVALGGALVLLAFLLIFVISPSGRRSTWEMALDDYLAYKRTLFGKTFAVSLSMQARTPLAFTEAWSGATFGDTQYYAVDYLYDDGSPGQRPLPFPPQEVWCVLVKERGAPEGTDPYQLLFVAQHQDLHSAAWVVHEGTAELLSQEAAAAMTALGCELNTDASAAE